MHSRKRTRYQDDSGMTPLQEKNGGEQAMGPNDVGGKISPEIEHKTISFLRGWFNSFSANAIPKSMDIRALAILTRLPISDVERLLVRTLHTNGIKDAAQNISVERKAIEFFRDWFNSFPRETLPKPHDIDALATLTRLPTSDVERLIMVQMLRAQPLGESETSIEAAPLPESNAFLRPRDPIFEKAVKLAKQKRLQCRPIPYHRLKRNQTRIYQCTLGCGQTFITKYEWRRHEEKNYPQDIWVCNLRSTSIIRGVSTCSYCDTKSPAISHVNDNHQGRISCCDQRLKGRYFLRKDKFLDHFNKFHPSIDPSEQANEAHVRINSPFPHHCGFCDETQNQSWLDRCDHIVTHFEAGRDMTTWRWPQLSGLIGDNNDNDNDNNDDDEDDDDDDDQGGGNQDEGNSKRDFRDSNNLHNAGSSKNLSSDSGYGSRGSGRSSANDTGSSMGSKQNNTLGTDSHVYPLIKDGQELPHRRRFSRFLEKFGSLRKSIAKGIRSSGGSLANPEREVVRSSNWQCELY
jgi:hypothetical protein